MTIGIDPGSSEIGVACYDGEQKMISFAKELKVASGSTMEKLSEIQEVVAQIVSDNPDVNDYVVEKMFIRTKSASVLLTAQKVIVDELKKNGKRVVEYSPMTWKKFMGAGNMDKKDVAEKLISAFGNKGLCDDTKDKPKYFLNASDATAMAVCGFVCGMSDEVNENFDKYVEAIS